MAIWIRPSGTEIELADTDNLEKFAKLNGWKKKAKKKAVKKAK